MVGMVKLDYVQTPPNWIRKVTRTPQLNITERFKEAIIAVYIMGLYRPSVPNDKWYVRY